MATVTTCTACDQSVLPLYQERFAGSFSSAAAICKPRQRKKLLGARDSYCVEAGTCAVVTGGDEGRHNNVSATDRRPRTQQPQTIMSTYGEASGVAQPYRRAMRPWAPEMPWQRMPATRRCTGRWRRGSCAGIAD